MKNIGKSAVKLLVFIAGAIALTILFTSYRHAHSHMLNAAAYYNCVTTSTDHADCEIISTTSTFGASCWSSYPMLSSNIKDGIDVSKKPGGAICPEFSGPYYIFDKNGKYLQTVAN